MTSQLEHESDTPDTSERSGPAGAPPLPPFGPPREEHFTSHLRSPAVASRIGVWLGVCFTIAFLTGLYSHWSQHIGWLPYPTSPSWGYRVTQGLHVTTGTAAIPLLLLKLWTVYPKLFASMPSLKVRELALAAFERGSIGVLVASGIFQLVTGLLNSTQWYPWGFAFPITHYALAWIAMGSLLVHIAVKLPIIRAALTSDIESTELDRLTTARTSSGLSRRGFVRIAWISSGVTVLATAGATVPFLRRISVFEIRNGHGPQGIPINRSAEAAHITDNLVADDTFQLTLGTGATSRALSLSDLQAMPQVTHSLPISCVEGWSAGATWTGVPVRHLLDLIDAPAGSDVTVTSLNPTQAYGTTFLPGSFSDLDDTLLALKLNGEVLSLDHGYPCRLIARNRPGVLQTKWVTKLETT